MAHEDISTKYTPLCVQHSSPRTAFLCAVLLIMHCARQCSNPERDLVQQSWHDKELSTEVRLGGCALATPACPQPTMPCSHLCVAVLKEDIVLVLAVILVDDEDGAQDLHTWTCMRADAQTHTYTQHCLQFPPPTPFWGVGFLGMVLFLGHVDTWKQV